MTRDPAPQRGREVPLYSQPWVLIGVGLGVTILGWFLEGAAEKDSALDSPSPALVGLGLFLIVAGFFTVAAGLLIRFRQRCWDLADRVETAAMLATAGLASLAGYFGMTPDWDSGRLLTGALFILAVVGVLLVLLPPLGRRIVLSLFVLYHFGGLVVAVTCVDPPGGSGPWVSKQLWNSVYRPYLTFLDLTNAYHFYSPDPGPPTLLWFAVCYDDGSYTWVKLPERSNSPVYMHYQRMLALPEHSFSPMPRLPFNNYEMALLGENAPKDQRQRGSWEMICTRRQVGSTRKYVLVENEDGKVIERLLPIPLVLGVSENLQYREPADTSKRILAGVAQRIYWNAPEAPRPGVKIKSVKMYRITQQVLTPQELARGISPWEKWKHWPYFFGEFDGQGRLLDNLDPFLYWYLPIAYVPNDYPDNVTIGALGAPVVVVNVPKSPNTFLLDSLEMHAAGEPRKEKPDRAPPRKDRKEETKQ